ncbi:MAG TPA: pseudaminic acid biosynthesis-associated methylase [Candidatus Limnocylindrales bacterium]
MVGFGMRFSKRPAQILTPSIRHCLSNLVRAGGAKWQRAAVAAALSWPAPGPMTEALTVTRPRTSRRRKGDAVTSERQAGPSEVERLEQLWAGDFGRRYADRNADAGSTRQPFWSSFLASHPAERVLEVGCNAGANLQWIAQIVGPGNVYGLDVSGDAINELHARLPSVNAICGVARDLPFRDAWFDLCFTAGVLIHQPEESLPAVMAEIVRVSRQYVLCGEYYSPEVMEVDYRGQTGALFKRDFGRVYLENFPSLKMVDEGFLGRDEGWDDITWWLLEKR